MDLVKGIKDQFGGVGNAHRIFQENLRTNPYYPFTRVGDKKFILKRNYPELYGGMALTASMLLVILYLLVTSQFERSSFLYSIVLILVGVMFTWTYKNPRVYTLDGDRELITFRVGRHVVHANYHQVYIRLMRAKTSRKGHLYHIIFNGCRFEKDIITRPSRNGHELRRLGRLLAGNLNLNYFDELNMSPHHLVRHARPETTRKNAGGL